MDSAENDSNQCFATLFHRSTSGDATASEQATHAVYTDLRALAGRMLRDRPDHILQPTALVHEAWLKVAGSLDRVNDRVHFFALAARAMRQVLADYARAEKRLKRGGGATRVTFNDEITPGKSDVDLVTLHDSLERLAELSERQADIVSLRLFGSLTIEECADLLGVSTWTIKSDWSMARAWLLREFASE